MINEQSIAFNNFITEKDYSIKEDTEILYLYFYDTTSATEYQLVGNKLEWRPIIWIEYEKERLSTLKKLILVSGNGKLDNFKVYLQRKFPAVVVESYVFDQSRLMNIILSKQTINKNVIRNKSVFCSLGNMRLNRYILVRWCQDNNIEIAYDEISNDDKTYYDYQMSKVWREPFITEFKNKSFKYFGTIPSSMFAKKLPDLLQQAFFYFAPTMPSDDMWTHRHDTKFFDAVRCSSIPFFICEKDANKNGMEHLGFKPYSGFNLSNESLVNPVERWVKILEDNKEIFTDLKISEEVYNQNKDVIKFNLDLLMNTNWPNFFQQQFDALPNSVQNEFEKTFNELKQWYDKACTNSTGFS